jgi:hypothetical protein
LLLASIVGQAEQNPGHEHLEAWAEVFAGDWVSETTAEEDSPLVKKGDKITARWSIDWSPDKEALLADYRAEVNGNTFVTVKGVTGWDSSEDAVVGRWFSSIGSSGKIVYGKDGDRWFAKWSTIAADKKKNSWTAHTTVVDRNTRKTTNTNRIEDGEPKPDQENVAKRR